MTRWREFWVDLTEIISVMLVVAAIAVIIITTLGGAVFFIRLAWNLGGTVMQ